ncbi:sensor histidine kinase [Paenibacillus sp. WLX1005]|uniref:sensor histidine kinase n=1 Tax=Paenibacillus sp. WLX1005 TaxID=3243766 RepID=UPI003984315F
MNTSRLERLQNNRPWFRLGAILILIYFAVKSYIQHPDWITVVYMIMICFFASFLWWRFQMKNWMLIIISLFLFTMTCVSQYLNTAIDQYFALLWAWFSILSVRSAMRQHLATVLLILTGILMLIFSYDGSLPYSMGISLVSLYVGITSFSRYIRINRINREQLEELEKVHSQLQSAHDALQENALQSVRYAALTERTRIAGEIHDGLGHHFTSIIVQLQALKWMIRPNPQQAEQTVDQLLDVSRQGLAEVRSVVKDWSASERTDDELRMLATQVAERSGLELTFHSEGDHDSWGDIIERMLYRLLQESLTNIVRHANATQVDVNIQQSDTTVQLTVVDNGSYREEQTLTHGFGLNNMSRRCTELHGSCSFRQTPGGGMTVEVELPLTAPAAIASS